MATEIEEAELQSGEESSSPLSKEDEEAQAIAGADPDLDQSEEEEETRSIDLEIDQIGDVIYDEESESGTHASDDSEGRDASSLHSRDSMQQLVRRDHAIMDLINNVTGLDTEGRPLQRTLTFSVKRYATAIKRNSEDYYAVYNWALALQESADNVDPESDSLTKDALLEEACEKYEEATRLCPTLHDAFYNWAIAISDRAKMRGCTKVAEELWQQATQKYQMTVQLNRNSPQALNNWGLALQFRAAILLEFDFHRAIYNLGTALYGLAEDTLRTGRQLNPTELPPDELYSQSAIYIAIAHALKSNYSVYLNAMQLVRSMLPLPYLKVGYLTAPPAGNSIAPHSEWKRTQFALNHEGLLQLYKADQKHLLQLPSGRLDDAVNIAKSAVEVNVPDIVSISACSDLTLPHGAGLSIDTLSGPVFLVADSWESLDGWLDALRLVCTAYARGRSDVLAGIITG